MSPPRLRIQNSSEGNGWRLITSNCYVYCRQPRLQTNLIAADSLRWNYRRLCRDSKYKIINYNAQKSTKPYHICKRLKNINWCHINIIYNFAFYIYTLNKWHNKLTEDSVPTTLFNHGREIIRWNSDIIDLYEIPLLYVSPLYEYMSLVIYCCNKK